MVDQLRLWTFYHPDDRFAAVEIDGHAFTCTDVSVETVDLEPRGDPCEYPWEVYVRPELEVTVTFKIRSRNVRRSDGKLFETRLVPNSVML